MGDLSEHFSRNEFVCKCCGSFIHNQKLIDELEAIRSIWGQRLHVTYHGGTRCPDQNDRSGGKPHSRHLTGEAADIWIETISPADVYHELCKGYPDRCGIGHYHTFTHFDVRDEKARWGA